MKGWSAYPIRFLLTAICENPNGLSQDQRMSAGVVARRLLEFAIAQNPRDIALVRAGILTVCRTYESDAVASKAILARLLEQEHLEAFGYEDMPTLAREGGRLLRIAPDFVRDLYAAAFSFDETRTEQTAMGTGRILPLTSNRRQDYNMARWQLGEIFPAFLKVAPAFAVESLVAAVAAEVEGRSHEYPEQTFDLNGFVARLREDLSYIWDSTEYRHEAHLKMLDAFEAELQQSASDLSLARLKEQLIAAVIKYNNWAAVWRRVLQCAIRNPISVGKQVAALTWSLPILTVHDTSILAGEFITAIYSELDASERERIKKAIPLIPGMFPVDVRDVATHISNRLLGCIPQESVSTPEAPALLGQMSAQGGPPPNRSPSRTLSHSWSRRTEEQFLADQGVRTEDEPNRRIRELTESIQAFVSANAQTAPVLADIETLLPRIVALRESLSNSSGAHDAQIVAGWNHLIAACARIARCENLDCGTKAGQIVRQLLVEGSQHPNPIPNAERDVDFDDQPSWSSAPRIDAAEGLLFLAHNASCMDANCIAQIDRLSNDLVPAVRLQIADRLGLLQRNSPETMVRILTHLAQYDPSSSVVFSLLRHQLFRLMPERSDEVNQLTTTIFGRTDLNGKMANEVHLTCVSIFLELFLWRGHKTSEALIGEFSTETAKFAQESAHIITCLREVLTVGPAETPDPICEAARARAFSLLEALTASAQRDFLALKQTHAKERFSEWPAADQGKAQRIAQLPDSISSQMYFASGAHAEKSNASQAERTSLSIGQKKRFLEESGKLFDLLSREPHPSTVHHLIETLQSLLEIDPRQVLLRITSIVEAGKGGGYQSESLAVELIVGVVNRIFADYRPMLQDYQEMRTAIVTMLDIFVEAGWPQAIQLTYRLDEIFR
jgi:hypothetical protein